MGGIVTFMRIFVWGIIGILIVALFLLYYPGTIRTVPSQIVKAQYQKPYKFTEDGFSSNAWHWSSTLKNFKDKPNLRYLEIGVYEGRSLLWMLENILIDPSSRATAIDMFPGDLEERFRANLNLSGFRDKVTVLKGTSQRQLRSLPFDSFDIIYIDGSHLAKHVYMDAALSWDLLRTDGLLIFDDYLYVLQGPLDQRPKISIDTFNQAFGDELEIVLNDYQLVVRKKGAFCRRYHCSTIGNYGYDWIERSLYELSNDKLVTLSEREKLAMERFLPVYVEARHDKGALARFKQGNQDFLMLQRKLNLLP
jgi:predicted O-methyltransferase YrrM